MKYNCPLCGQPVAPSLYQKITGIWQERQKALQKIKEQRNKIRELEKQLEKQTTPQWEGLLYEDGLTRELKKRFPQDQFEQTRKGGDILHNIFISGRKVGLIVYECKRVQHYSFGHVKQASDAKQKRHADFVILVTNAMKKGTQGFFTERGVIVVHSAGIISLVGIVRNQIVRMAEMKLGQQERDKAIRRTLEYLEDPEFANSLDAIIQESIALYKEWVEEIKRHVAVWKRRYNSYQKIAEEASRVKTTTQALLSGEDEYEKLVQTVSLPATLMLPELEESVSSQRSAEEAKNLSHEPRENLRQTVSHKSVPNPSARSRARA